MTPMTKPPRTSGKTSRANSLITLPRRPRSKNCSDGIIEAANTEEDIFGFEQTAETIRAGCAEGLSAEALIDRLVGVVQDFAGDEPQGDDMTCVVLRVEG